MYYAHCSVTCFLSFKIAVSCKTGKSSTKVRSGCPLWTCNLSSSFIKSSRWIPAIWLRKLQRNPLRFMPRVFMSLQVEKFTTPDTNHTSLPNGVCSLRRRILSGFFSRCSVPFGERAPSIRFSRGIYYVPFSLILSLSRILSLASALCALLSRCPFLFVFISSARQWFAAIKPHRQATHVYRVSKDTRSFFPSAGPSSRDREFMIYL